MFGVAAVGCGSSSSGTGGDGAAGGSGDDTPAAITIVAGNDQEAEAGTEVPIDPVARVTNAAGEPLGR